MPLPKTIKIDGKEVSISDVPELQGLIETVRKEEKDKLHSKIQSHEAKILELETAAKQGSGLSEAQKKELEEAKSKLAVAEADKKRVDEEAANLKKEIEQLKGEDGKGGKGKGKEEGVTVAQIAELIEQANAKQRAELEKVIEARVGKVDEGLEQKKFEDYKNSVLEKHKDTLIPEFLGGNTKEELDKNLAAALEKSKDYILVEHGGTKMTLAEREKAVEQAEAAAKAKAEEEKGGSGGDGSGGGANPHKPESGGGAVGSTKLEEVKKLSDEEYAKNRSAILKDVRKLKYEQAEE